MTDNVFFKKDASLHIFSCAGRSVLIILYLF